LIPFPAISEPFVSGIPTDAVCGMIAVGASLTLAGVTNVCVNNPWCFNVVGTTVKCIKEGSTCVKMTTSSGATRLYGLYSSKNPPKNRLLLGSVSEHDPQNAMRWWSEFDCKDTSDPVKVLCNKKCDIAYVYLNGGSGPNEYSWRNNYATKAGNTEPEGKRAFNFIRNCLRLGQFPCFVWYCVPAGSESHYTNKQNYTNPTYMKHYFDDLNFFLNIVKQESKGLPVYIVLEPDMLSYVLVNEPWTSQEYGVDALTYPFELSEVKSLDIPELRDLTIKNTMFGYNEAVNTLIARKCPNVSSGCKINLWASLTAGNWAKGLERGLIPATSIVGQDAGLALIKKNATIIANYYKRSGATLNATTIFFDRYGLDGGITDASSASEPQNSRWFWNNDIWRNYIYFVKEVSTTLGLKAGIWQMPCGYINNSTEISPYTNKPYPLLTNVAPSGEDGSPTFFFGGSFTRSDPTTLAYFGTNNWKDNVKVVGNTITYPDHTDFLFENGIESLMVGAGVGASTTNLYMGQSAGLATDNKYCISKFQQYYVRKM
jgi:hypothetical protein